MKTWNFLLPDTGEHELKGENLGKSGQKVSVDGVELPAPEGTTMFTGPGGCLLEIRQRNGAWELLVNGFLVEDYSQGKRKTRDDTLRDLRSRPDGSYTIATSFSAEGLSLNTVRKFRFTAQGVLHEVEIAHFDWVWQVLHNGHILDRLTHSMWESKKALAFKVDVLDGHKLDVEVSMTWEQIKQIWIYCLCVNHISVPACWTKTGGELAGVLPPEVWGEGAPLEEAAEAPLPEELPREPVAAPADLPQGVSYDSSSGSYQANIRVNNRFVFLGEFATIPEAEARYREEAEKIRAKSNGTLG
mmetsp:Transcript_131688/g.232841  ORF Transcript_131688/g.232841 Transcript_131688/m.232841 type:complete len:301 (-) Transcript_131688:142-1044(-)